jgi:hypothetical protein
VFRKFRRTSQFFLTASLEENHSGFLKENGFAVRKHKKQRKQKSHRNPIWSLTELHSEWEAALKLKSSNTFPGLNYLNASSAVRQ